MCCNENDYGVGANCLPAHLWSYATAWILSAHLVDLNETGEVSLSRIHRALRECERALFSYWSGQHVV